MAGQTANSERAPRIRGCHRMIPIPPAWCSSATARSSHPVRTSRMKGYKVVNRKFSATVWPLLAAAAILCALAPAKAQEKNPNIVFMLVDNLGYGELGVYGGGLLRGAPTPRIDKLASEGMRLLNFNVESQCTATRSAFMTGRFSIRSGTYKVPLGRIPDGLTLWEVTIAELLSAKGYATGM